MCRFDNLVLVIHTLNEFHNQYIKWARKSAEYDHSILLISESKSSFDIFIKFYHLPPSILEDFPYSTLNQTYQKNLSYHRPLDDNSPMNFLIVWQNYSDGGGKFGISWDFHCCFIPATVAKTTDHVNVSGDICRRPTGEHRGLFPFVVHSDRAICCRFLFDITVTILCCKRN